VKTNQKIVSRQQLKQLISRHRKSGKKIAFTNGCFDLIHYGHVQYLQKAKKANRILIIGLNSDNSVRKLKGKSRPLVPLSQRAGILAALTCVDYVCVFSEQTPKNLIRVIKPDILIKGADWKKAGVVGSEIVHKYGGRVEFVKLTPRASTTNLIRKIVQACKK